MDDLSGKKEESGDGSNSVSSIEFGSQSKLSKPVIGSCCLRFGSLVLLRFVCSFSVGILVCSLEPLNVYSRHRSRAADI